MKIQLKKKYWFHIKSRLNNPPYAIQKKILSSHHPYMKWKTVVITPNKACQGGKFQIALQRAKLLVHTKTNYGNNNLRRCTKTSKLRSKKGSQSSIVVHCVLNDNFWKDMLLLCGQSNRNSNQKSKKTARQKCSNDEKKKRTWLGINDNKQLENPFDNHEKSLKAIYRSNTSFRMTNSHQTKTHGFGIHRHCCCCCCRCSLKALNAIKMKCYVRWRDSVWS